MGGVEELERHSKNVGQAQLERGGLGWEAGNAVLEARGRDGKPQRLF
jgi:hypothetical protein